jgi:hypothetical protein
MWEREIGHNELRRVCPQPLSTFCIRAARQGPTTISWLVPPIRARDQTGLRLGLMPLDARWGQSNKEKFNTVATIIFVYFLWEVFLLYGWFILWFLCTYGNKNYIIFVGYDTEDLTGAVYTVIKTAILHTNGWLLLTQHLETSHFSMRIRQLLWQYVSRYGIMKPLYYCTFICAVWSSYQRINIWHICMFFFLWLIFFQMNILLLATDICFRKIL